jgi:hypothetical protein
MNSRDNMDFRSSDSEPPPHPKHTQHNRHTTSEGTLYPLQNLMGIILDNKAPFHRSAAAHCCVIYYQGLISAALHSMNRRDNMDFRSSDHTQHNRHNIRGKSHVDSLPLQNLIGIILDNKALFHRSAAAHTDHPTWPGRWHK